MPLISIENTNENNFDFLLGEWLVKNRALRQRLTNSSEWNEFDAQLYVEKRAFGQVDKYVAVIDDHSFEGCTIRSYDPIRKVWRLYWIDSWNPEIQPAPIGGFKNGIGTFFCPDTYNGKSIFVRFIWNNITPSSAHWEQAFSTDDGNTWETNWHMDFTRIENDQQN